MEMAIDYFGCRASEKKKRWRLQKSVGIGLVEEKSPSSGAGRSW
jgi:hypothetical protein